MIFKDFVSSPNE
jgi:hypothetical protein